MVKKHFLLTVLIFLIYTNSYASSNHPTYNTHNFFGTYKVSNFKKQSNCFSSVTKQTAELHSNKKIILTRRKFTDFWDQLLNPYYQITQLTPEPDEVVYPKHLQRLFNINGTYLDQLTFLTVWTPSKDYPYEYLEIVDEHTLLLESGCWVYTLKKIKK